MAGGMCKEGVGVWKCIQAARNPLYNPVPEPGFEAPPGDASPHEGIDAGDPSQPR